MNRSRFPDELAGSVDPGRLTEQIISGWQSPSNIALIKYWGKRPGQLPLTPSLSMTLENAFTQTIVTATRRVDEPATLVINDDPSHPFLPKLHSFLNRMADEIPVLKHYSFRISTRNSFPHSTGIASSASGLSAFTLCLLSVACTANSADIPVEHLMPLASYAARMGSGSACRSVYGGFTVWGKTVEISCSSDLEALPVQEVIHPGFHSLQDAILVISRSPKPLSSSQGHDTMTRHPYLPGRIKQSAEHFSMLLKGLKEGDMNQVALLTETEALSLHALLMSVPEGAVLVEPNTLAVLQKIRQARSGGLPVFFTLDAGPNVHMLYPPTHRDQIRSFIENELTPFCTHGLWIDDWCGDGPRKIQQISVPDRYTK